MKKFLTICCLSLLFAGCSNTLDEYPSTAEENATLSRTVTESAAVTKKIEVSPAFQGNCLLVLSNYANQIEEQLDMTAEALVTGVENGSFELSPLNASEESVAVPTLDSEKGALEVTLPQDLCVGTHLQTGVVFHKKGETEGLQFVFDISVVEFNENNATAMKLLTNNKVYRNDDLPDVLLSGLVMNNLCTIPIIVRVASPNHAYIGNGTPNGSSAVVKPLFITEDDKFYVEALIEHPGCQKAKVIRVTNNYTYAEEIPYIASVLYRGYIPLAHPVGGTEHIAFITK